jgi:hypothetical protein
MADYRLCMCVQGQWLQCVCITPAGWRPDSDRSTIGALHADAHGARCVLRRLPVLSDWGALFAAADASAAAALPAAERLDLVTALSAAVHATAEREAAARGDMNADAAGALPLKSTARKGRKGRGRGAGEGGGDDDAGSLRGATIVLMDALPRLFADYGAEPHAVRLQ